MITTSLEWNSLESCLRRRARGLAHSNDVIKMIDNIRPEITELSKAEILARRGVKRPAVEILEKVNKDIEMVEEFILVAALLG